MMLSSWIKFCLAIVMVALLALWGWRECATWQQRVIPRLSKVSFLPDTRTVRSRAMLERVNIHTPDFALLARAISGNGAGTEHQGALKEGAQYYRYITELAPNRFDAYLVQGACEYGLRNYPDAEQALKRALYLSPNFFWTYYDLGMFYFNNGMYPVARGFLEGALARLGSYDDKALRGSKIFMDLLRSDEGMSLSQGMVKASRDLQMASAVSCFILGDFACVMKSSDAGRKSGGGAAFLTLSGAAAFQMKDDVRAAILLSGAIAEDPLSGAAHFFLALSLKRTGDEAGFETHYARAMELKFDPKEFLAGIKFPLRVY
ncbi:MAG: hypothetical protein HQL21_04125 [Candidatus Omnitrophica bacterium]|nr:hypothetical protein [Candidatus Omnitrophota bacterium]